MIGHTLSTFTEANQTCESEKAYLTTVEDRYLTNLIEFKNMSNSKKFSARPRYQYALNFQVDYVESGGMVCRGRNIKILSLFGLFIAKVVKYFATFSTIKQYSGRFTSSLVEAA